MKNNRFKQERQRRLNQQRQSFLLTFFDEDEGNTHKEVNGFVLEKQWNGNQQVWQVAIYSQESWKKREQYIQKEDNLDWIQ